MLETWQEHLAAKLALKYPRPDIIGALIFAVALLKNAADLNISDEDLRKAGEIFQGDNVRGERYAKSHMISLFPED